MDVLFVSAYVPSRIRVRSFNFIKALVRRGHTVALVCGATPTDGPAIDEMRSICREVVPVVMGRAAMLANTVRALPNDLPLQAAVNFAPALEDAVRRAVAAHPYDLAHLEHLRAAALRDALASLPMVFDSVDSISLLFERTLRGNAQLKTRALALLDLARTRRYESRYTRSFERILVSGPDDVWALGVLAHDLGSAPADAAAQIRLIRSGVDLGYFMPQPVERVPETLVFSGKMSYHANIAAVLFLVHEIMPLIWARRPSVRLNIVGSAPTPAVQALARDARITVTGFVPDMRPYLAGAVVAVAPIRYGAGTLTKALEAMAVETPLVTSRLMARSTPVEDGRDALLRDSAEEYAAAVLQLLNDPALCRRLGTAGRAYIERHHNWNGNLVEALEHVYSEVIGAGTQRAAAPRFRGLAPAGA
jgi:glycosyltransferase involved in cell wall biosynthesis